jgi:hypothetical protein
MPKISMYCPECEVYTKSYNEQGLHNCGNDVMSGVHSFVDVNFEGWIEEQKDGSIKLISR